MQELKIKQQQGTVSMVPSSNYLQYHIAENEQHLIHVGLEIPNFDRTTGKRLSKPFVQTFTVDEFTRMTNEGAFRGYKVDILHDPRSTSKGATKGEDATETATNTKPLERMNKAELQARYKELYGEDAASELKNEELRAAIEEKIAFLNEEKGGTSEAESF